MTGIVGYLAGLHAEDQVERHYVRSGRAIAARRWRGLGGEIDLIAREGDTVVFIEVKRAKTHDLAMQKLGMRQLRRIMLAAGEFLDGEPKGSLTDARIDVALVDGVGRISVIENLQAA